MKLGTIVFTRGVSDAAHGNFKFFNDVLLALKRYKSKDWGELCEEDKATNDDALVNGGRLLGKYNTSNGAIYIITEWDGSVTTILFPEEY